MITLSIYILVFSLAAAAAMSWIHERGGRKYRLRAAYNSNTLLVASFSFIFTYLPLALTCIMFRRRFYLVQIVISALIILYGALKERQYRNLRAEFLGEKMKEIASLENAAAKDASNSAFWERLSELYEELGRKKEAVEAAKKAALLNPGVATKWRLDRLLN